MSKQIEIIFVFNSQRKDKIKSGNFYSFIDAQIRLCDVITFFYVSDRFRLRTLQFPFQSSNHQFAAVSLAACRKYTIYYGLKYSTEEVYPSKEGENRETKTRYQNAIDSAIGAKVSHDLNFALLLIRKVKR